MENVSKLYLESGYLNIPAIFNYPTTFNFIVAARGTGKSYGALKYIYESGRTAIYLRRTQKQADKISKAALSPFKPVADDLSIAYEVQNVVTDVTAVCSDGRVIYYTAALSTFSSLRSFDMSDVDYIFYDEFIPERSEKSTIRFEYEAFLNMYETVNRNRELSGKPPVKLVAAANANTLDNKIFIGLNLVSVTDRMMKKGLEEYHDMSRGISLYYPVNSPVSKQKASTALYRLAGESEFSDMALKNSYNVDMSDVGPRPEREYKPLATLGRVCVMVHKSDSECFYVIDGQRAGSAPSYPDTQRGIMQFKERHGRVIYYWLFGKKFYYQNLTAKTLFTTYMNES